MKRTAISPEEARFPQVIRPLLRSGPVYDSSCSQTARVWYLSGCDSYLKCAPAGSLRDEAEMTAWFHQKGLAPEVLQYLPLDRDWLLTRRLPGEDCVFPAYLAEPARLCDILALRLRALHETDPAGCPVTDCTRRYLTRAEAAHQRSFCDLDLFPRDWSFAAAEEARREVLHSGPLLSQDTLIHGDYCLPNILLDNWQFSGFLDLGRSGLGDRHVDLFWGLWTLRYNLKTNAFYGRFLDAYGRDAVTPELLRTVAAMEVFL